MKYSGLNYSPEVEAKLASFIGKYNERQDEIIKCAMKHYQESGQRRIDHYVLHRDLNEDPILKLIFQQIMNIANTSIRRTFIGVRQRPEGEV